MKIAACVLLLYAVTGVLRADEVAIRVSAAEDATSCTTRGTIVAKAQEAHVSAPLKPGLTTYQLQLAPDRTWQIGIAVPGCWSETLTWSSGAAAAPLQLHLERAGMLNGTFQSEDVPKHLQARLFPIAGAARSEPLLEGIATECALDWPNWQCAVPASRRLDVRLHAAGFAPLFFWDVRAGADEAAQLPVRRLEKGASVAGWVENPNGDPETNARVSLVPLEAAASGATAKQRASARTSRTKTDARGFFQFTGVTSGTYQIVSEAVGVSPARTTDIRVTADDAVTWPIPIAHVPSPALVLLVEPATDTRGHAWTAEFVAHEPYFPETNEPVRRMATATGRITADGLHAGMYEVRIRDTAGSVVEILDVDLSAGGEHTLTVNVRSIAATGKLRCGEEPLEGELTFTNLSGRSLRTKTDADGRFEIALPAAGLWQVELRYPLAARASMIELDPVEVPQQATTTLDLRVPGGRIKGQVMAANGAGEQAAVHVVSVGRPVAQLITSADGTFDIVGIRPGTYAVDAEGRSGMTAKPVGVTIGNDETQTLALRLEPYRRVAGVIRTPYGTPASGALVRISSDGGQSWTRTIADVKGSFDYRLPSTTDEVQLVVLTYAHPAVALRAVPHASRPLEINLPASGGLLRVNGGSNPIVRIGGMSVPLRLFHFPEPHGRYDGGAYLHPGTYAVCPDADPGAECRNVAVGPSSEVRVRFNARAGERTDSR
ncbi:MAG TPA: carboxypeptidase-like regulatory domain-containing protein [Thermoanaerobaculia bacterium]|nr:carboxypeptidase-like regulatory domain-containing protein [Thermoanaerobaculia bacterium]